jgi:peptide/nickel transport system ATP-binding protein
MYEGRIVEVLPTMNLKNNAAHPYTQELLRAVPQLGVRRLYAKRNIYEEIIKEKTQGQGCPYLARCRRSKYRCLAIMPKLISYGTSQVACHFPGEESNQEMTEGWLKLCY